MCARAQVLTEAKLEGLIDFVHACCASLTAQSTGSAEALNDKFSSSAKFQMTCAHTPHAS